MLQHPLLRIFMAVYLALWSPVMCCCAVKSSLGRITGVQVECCSQTAMTPDAEETAPTSCCAARQQTKSPCEQPTHTDDCKCKSKSRLAISGSTGANVAGLALMEVLPAIVSHSIADLSPGLETACLDRAWRLAHGPPHDSLFAQHCLLTV